MEFSVTSANPENQKCACIVVGVYEKNKLSPTAKALDTASGGYISQVMKTGDIKGKAGQTLMLHGVPDIKATRILLVGMGDGKSASDSQYVKSVSAAAKVLSNNPATDCLCALSEIKVQSRDLAWKITKGSVAFTESEYRSDTLKSEKDDEQKNLQEVVWFVEDKNEHTQAKEAANAGKAIGDGSNLARELGNLPGNICTPTYLAEQAINLGSRYDKIKTKILEENDMEKLGMGALLSVARGSRQPAKFIIMDYNGGKAKSKPVVFVGKGLTFDSGGISIKPSQTMDEMKYDMCGGASVFGVMQAIAEMKLPINVIGVVPSSENMPDGDANKPGDIVTSLSGQTIEVLNTDAEGRLILCDALTYVERFDPEIVIDIATLTGACVVALGKHATGLLSNDDKLAEEIKTAANDSYDRVWQLPLWDDYQEQLKSNFADMANIGGPQAGTITAACFLSRYTKNMRWAHLDIAGTAWHSGADKGSTGRPVSLLTQIVLNRV